jgi:iron(III) transport system substrate-binding protein
MPAGAFWNVASALGAMHVFPGTGSGAQFERLSRGDSVIGYNLLASHATGRIKKDLPNLAVELPADHTLVVTRVMFISRSAAHPNAAKLWVDYLLSRRGQEQLARADLGALRGDVDDPMTPAAPGRRLGSAVKPIAVGPQLLEHLDAARQSAFQERWMATAGASH